MKNKKICMVAYAEYFNDGRIKGYVNNLLKNGFSVDIFCLQDSFSKSKPQNNLFIKFLGSKYQGHSKKLYLLSYIVFLVRAFFIITTYNFKERYSVIHVHNQPDFLVFCTIIPKLFGSKIILDLHDIMMAGVTTKFNSSQKSLLFQLIKLQTQISVAFCDVLFCADHSQQEFLLENRIKKNNFYVFLNLPNNEFFKRRITKYSSESIVKIINHGTLSYRLGIDILIKAVEIASKNINITLTLLGGGEQKSELISYCKDKGILDKIIIFKDFIPIEMLQDEIEKYDIGVISMRSNPVYERCMLPVKLLEYAYIGIPVIASDLYGIRKYFSDDMVEYVPPDDVGELTRKIISLANNTKRRTELITNSFKFFDRYNWIDQEKKYLSVIQDLIRK